MADHHSRIPWALNWLMGVKLPVTLRKADGKVLINCPGLLHKVPCLVPLPHFSFCFIHSTVTRHLRSFVLNMRFSIIYLALVPLMGVSIRR